jgi:hypothetical protein
MPGINGVYGMPQYTPKTILSPEKFIEKTLNLAYQPSSF